KVAYVGNKGTKLYSVRDINQVDPVSAAELACGHCEQDGRPFANTFPFLGFVNFLENGDDSIYHGLQTTVTQRAWRGLNFVIGYTYAHAIDDVSLNRAAQPQDSTRPGLERASGDNDIRHRFTFSLSYDLPSRKGYGQLLEGWQINSIVVVQSGPPFTAVDFENDTSLTGEFSDRWNVIGNPKSIKNWSLDPSRPVDISTVLQQPTNCGVQLCFGNGGRNTFRAPGYHNWDFSVVKMFRLTERADVQFRAEFF